MYWTTCKIYFYASLKFFDQFVAVDNLIYLFNSPLLDNAPFNIHVLNTNTLEWSLLFARSDINSERSPPHAPLKRYGHTILAYDEKIYLWGGKNHKTQTTNTLYCFDTKTLSWSRPQVTGIIPSARYYHSACISNAESKMYILGGFEVNTHQLLRDVHCLDLKTMNWTNIITTGVIPRRLNYLTAVVDNRMYIIHGGYDNIKDTFSNVTMYLDLESNQWHHPKTTGNIPVGPNDRSLFVHNNIIYVFGAYDNSDNNLYYFNTKRNNWNLIKPPGKSPKQRNDQACIITRDKMFLLGISRNDSYISRARYNNTINVLDFNPSLETLAKITIVENGLDTSCLPTDLRSQIHDFTLDNI